MVLPRPSSTDKTALIASHLPDRVQNGVHGPSQQMPSLPQRVSAGSEPGRQPFLFPGPLFGTICLFHQIVADSDCLQTQPEVTFLNCAFN